MCCISASSCSDDDTGNEIVNPSVIPPTSLSYTIVDTDVKTFYSDLATVSAIGARSAFYGQDATYIKNEPSYIDNVTGLMWQKERRI